MITLTATPPALRAAARRIRVAISALVAAILGLLPHVLHHAGPLAGAALLGGVAGSLLFGAAGLVLAVPFLLKVRRHCGNWRVPALLLASFAAIFSVSTFVVGPAITSEGDESGAPALRVPAGGANDGGAHTAHHR